MSNFGSCYDEKTRGTMNNLSSFREIKTEKMEDPVAQGRWQDSTFVVCV